MYVSSMSRYQQLYIIELKHSMLSSPIFSVIMNSFCYIYDILRIFWGIQNQKFKKRKANTDNIKLKKVNINLRNVQWPYKPHGKTLQATSY